MKTVKLTAVVMFMLAGTTAIAQETPQFEVAGQYSLAHYNPARKYVQNPHNLNGGGGSFTYNVPGTSWLGLKADIEHFGGTAWSFNLPDSIPTSNGIIPAGTYKASGGLNTFLFGPQVKYHGRKFQPWAHALFGGASSNLWTNLLNTSGVSNKTNKDVNGFAIETGGGVDIVVHKMIAIRPLEFDYLQTRLNPPGLAINRLENQNNWRYSAGVVLNLGTVRK